MFSHRSPADSPTYRRIGPHSLRGGGVFIVWCVSEILLKIVAAPFYRVVGSFGCACFFSYVYFSEYVDNMCTSMLES